MRLFRFLAILFSGLPMLLAEGGHGHQQAAIAERLQHYFDRQLESPEIYGKLALRECRMFPEGDLFPFVFPALGYAHLAMSNPSKKSHSTKQVHKLILLCIPSVAGQLQAQNRDLLKVKTLPPYATHVGQLNLILSYYRALGGDDAQLLALNDHLSSILLAALEKSRGTPLLSYPQTIWPFDTAPCLVSLVAWGKEESRVNAVKVAHLHWLDGAGLNREFSLPYSQIPGSRPRGCDLSLRLAFLRMLDPALADKYYQRYRQHFWLERGFLAGFAEWPGGTDASANVDSGAIVLGIGVAATGNGFAAARALGDRHTLEKLNTQLEARDTLVMAAAMDTAKKGWIYQSFKGMGLQFDPAYFTGFLFGDAILFGTITWPE